MSPSSWNKGSKIWHAGQIQPGTHFGMAYKIKMILTVLAGWEKVKKIIIHDIWNSHFSVHKVVLRHTHTHAFTYCIATFRVWWQNWVATADLWPTKYKIFSMWTFTEKVCWILPQNVKHLDSSTNNTNAQCRTLFVFVILIWIQFFIYTQCQQTSEIFLKGWSWIKNTSK